MTATAKDGLDARNTHWRHSWAPTLSVELSTTRYRSRAGRKACSGWAAWRSTCPATQKLYDFSQGVQCGKARRQAEVHDGRRRWAGPERRTSRRRQVGEACDTSRWLQRAWLRRALGRSSTEEAKNRGARVDERSRKWICNFSKHIGPGSTDLSWRDEMPLNVRSENKGDKPVCAGKTETGKERIW